MASDKKPSMYSGRGTIGSAEELETYGVWVKSEPQDFTASLAEAANFNADALPYEADFDTGFDNMGAADFGMLGPELTIPEMSVSDDEFGAFDDGLLTDVDRGSEEASTQLLMKIAGELSSIRSELNTLKKEFAELRGEDGANVDALAEIGALDTDFFSAGEGDDEKIALSGDEMESFFNAADFPTEEEMGFAPQSSLTGEGSPFDAQRDADEAALKELEAQNNEEEIPIDFDNLGNLDLDGDAVADTEELPPLESSADDDDFAMPSFDTLSFDEAPSDESPSTELDKLEEGFAEELVPLEEDPEVQELSAELEGSLSEETALEPQPSPMGEGSPLDDSLLGITAEDTQPEAETAAAGVAETEDTEEQSVDLSFDDLSFDEAGFDLELDDLSTESAPAVEEPVEEAVEEPVFDTSTLELSETAAEEPLPDIESMDLSDAVIDEPDLSGEIVDPPLEEPVLSDLSFGDDLSLDMDSFETEAQPEEPVEEGELAAKTDEEPADELGAIDLGEDFELDKADDLAVIDLASELEQDTQSSPTDEGSPLDTFETEDTGKAADEPATHNDIISDVDDSVIPEGFEVNAKEAAPSLDDDLEAFVTDEELAITGDDTPADSADKLADDSGESSAIPPALKSELRNVLSYMDHLLESLPEDKIEEFAQSEYFDRYKKIFKELGLV